MSIEALLKAIVVLHHGNTKQHAMVKYSVAKQIQKNDIRPITINGKTVDTMEMIIATKYHPFAINGGIATRTIEALLVHMTVNDEIKLILQANHTECPVVNGEIIIEQEQMITQVNQLITIEEYTKICQDFELYFEDDD